MAKKKLTKHQEKQYNELSARFNLTRSEFLEFYTILRKANKKGYYLKGLNSALYVPKYSLGTKHIKTRKDFLRLRRSAREVVKKGYRSWINATLRDRLYDNLRKLFGRKAPEVIRRFKAMTDANISMFFDINEDIQFMLYESDPLKMAKFINLTFENINARLDAFNPIRQQK